MSHNTRISLAVLVTVFSLGIASTLEGCKSLSAGADPLVVRVEQGQSVAKSTFDMVLNLDNSNRPFWRTNAPAFHSFAEWLRTPSTYEATNTLPRCVVIQLNIDDLKLAYKSSKTTSNSNALWTAFGTLSELLTQAQSWQSIITNSVYDHL